MMTWTTFAASAALVWYVILLGIGIIGWREAQRRYALKARSPLSSATADQVEGVSILRPLKGLDPNMYENLETTFLQLYPKFEIIFAVADEKDPAARVARELITKYPNVDARVSIGEEIVGVNPKVNNLMQPYREAKYDILWVLDSNVQVVPETLARSVDALNRPPKSPNGRRIGLVHHVPFAIGSDSSTGAQLERAFLNTNHAKMYIALNALAIDSCVMGKSNMYRRSDVDRLNGTLKPRSSGGGDETSDNHPIYGLAAFGRFLAEDAMIGSSIWHELGLRHDLGFDVAANAIGEMSFYAYARRRARWIRVRKRLVLAATLLEPLTESVVAGLLASWGLYYLTSTCVPIWITFLLHSILFLVVDLNVRYLLTGEPLYSSEWWSFVASWAGRELLAFPIWIFAILGNEVEWRGGNYRLLPNGETAKVDGSSHKSGIMAWYTRRPAGYEPIRNLES